MLRVAVGLSRADMSEGRRVVAAADIAQMRRLLTSSSQSVTVNSPRAHMRTAHTVACEHAEAYRLRTKGCDRSALEDRSPGNDHRRSREVMLTPASVQLRVPTS